MNKRFRELAKESRLLTGWVVGEYKYQKFAELIVRECASIAYKTCQDGDAVAQAILYEFDIDNTRSQK